MIYPGYIKRTADIVGSLVLILLTGWLFVLIVMAYLITFARPVFFSQLRTGKDSKPFKMWKFRTLKNGPALEDRRFALGDFLRATSLDELPQVLNVLRGDMSIVGPRPLPIGYLPLMTEGQRVRNKIKPGITGLAQVSGRHSISWERKFELDNYYVSHASVSLDVQILFKTIVLLLSFHKDNSLAEKPFEGSPGNE